MKKNNIARLEKGLVEVDEFIKEFKKRNISCSVNIQNKDMLLLLLTKSMDADKRIAKIEGLLEILIPIIFALIGLNISGVI